MLRGACWSAVATRRTRTSRDSRGPSTWSRSASSTTRTPAFDAAAGPAQINAHRRASEPVNDRSRSKTVRIIEIAELLGVSHQRASKIVDEPGFPAPIGHEGQSRLWNRREVVAWAKGWRRERKPWRLVVDRRSRSGRRRSRPRARPGSRPVRRGAKAYRRAPNARAPCPVAPNTTTAP